MARLVVATITLLVAFSSTPAAADFLVLLDGTRFKGTLANAQHVRLHPEQYTQISFLVEIGERVELRRFPVREIEYVFVRDADGVAVIDFGPFNGTQQPDFATPIERTAKPDYYSRFFALKGGLTWGQIHGKRSTDDWNDHRSGITGGFSMSFMSTRNLGLRLGASYVEKGSQSTTIAGSRTAGTEFSANYIEVPVQLEIRLPSRNANVDLTLFMGPSIAFLVEATRTGTGWASLGLPELDRTEDISDTINRVDLGVNIGVGIELHVSPSTSLVFEGSANRGLAPFDDDFPKWTLDTVSATVGLSWRFGEKYAERTSWDEDRWGNTPRSSDTHNSPVASR